MPNENSYRIEYRFNNQGRYHHWCDIFDDTGDCVKTFGGSDKEVVKQQARDWIRSPYR